MGPKLKLEELNCPREKTYFIVAVIFALILWGVIVFTVFGALIGLLIGLFSWLGNGLLVAHLRSSCIKVDERQLPELHRTVQEVCSRLGTAAPEVYVLQSEGFLNAFAMRHCGRDFVVLYSSLAEGFDHRGDEVRFYLGHEVGHLKSKHILKQIFLFPVLWLPLLGPAYDRACEASCDRYGAFCADTIDGAVRGLVVLAGGKALAGKVDAAVFAGQAQAHRGFFVSWYELISGYQTLSRRAANLMAAAEGRPEPSYPRNPFSYLFALFTIGFGRVSAGGIFVTVAVIAMLAAIAIPNLLRAKLAANDSLAKHTVQSLSLAAEAYASAHDGVYPSAVRDLTEADPPYITASPCSQTRAGFSYECDLSPRGYKFTAAPAEGGSSGSRVFTATTGQVFDSFAVERPDYGEEHGPVSGRGPDSPSGRYSK